MARERLNECSDPSLLARWQAQLEHEAAHLAVIVKDFANLQQEKIEAAKQKLVHQWNESEAHRRLVALEESLLQQYRRLQLIGSEPAAA